MKTLLVLASFSLGLSGCAFWGGSESPVEAPFTVPVVQAEPEAPPAPKALPRPPQAPSVPTTAKNLTDIMEAYLPLEKQAFRYVSKPSFDPAKATLLRERIGAFSDALIVARLHSPPVKSDLNRLQGELDALRDLMVTIETP